MQYEPGTRVVWKGPDDGSIQRGDKAIVLMSGSKSTMVQFINGKCRGFIIYVSKAFIIREDSYCGL